MRPHDLLWPDRPLRHCLPGAPAWASPHWPVVVRRAIGSSARMIPVGLRGPARHQRHADWLDVGHVVRVVTPETLARQFMGWPDARHAWDTAPAPEDTESPSPGEAQAPDAGSAETARASSRLRADMPPRPTEPAFPPPACVRTLARIAPMLDETGLAWGPTGAVGFWLACGAPVLHAGSDLDLVVYAVRPPQPEAIGLLHALTARADCRLDIQIETGKGAFALAEWLAGRSRVLLRTASGPQLVTDPWQAVHADVHTCAGPLAKPEDMVS